MFMYGKKIRSIKSIFYSDGHFHGCRVRFHYGHPDIFDRMFHLTRGGISKASKTINLSEDVFAGMLNFFLLLKLHFSCHFQK